VIWMIVSAHRQLRSRSRRWLLYPVFAMLALAAVGGGYETVRDAVDANAYPMPGQLIDVGGHRLHLNCTGSGSPTVVLEPGAGEMSSNLGWITPAIARDTRVCVYDRAGRGWSEAADAPQDANQIATDLQTITGPVKWDGANLPPFAAKNVCKTPLVGGQWRRKSDGKFELVIVDNSHAPQIPAGGKMEAITY